MNTLLQDLRFALRMLAKNPGFTAVAVLTLALGIGANTAMFTVIDSVLLRPVPLRDGGRLVSIPLMVGQYENSVTWSQYQDLRRRSHFLEDVAGIGGDPSVLEAPNGGERVGRATVTENFLDMLGVHPALGRTFSSEDFRFGAARVVLLGAEVWRSRFNADDHVLGRLVRIGGVAYTVVGVMPDGFHFQHDLERDLTSTVWLPMPPSAHPNEQSLELAGKLKVGVSPQAAQSELAAIALNIWPNAHNVRFLVIPYRDALTASARPALLALTGALVLVLLIACVNVANLQFTRFLSRRQELSVRAALGAERRRLLRQLVTEGTMLALAGAAVGLGFAFILMMAVHRLPANFVPRADEIKFRLPVFSLLAVMAAAATILSSLAPALLATRTPPEGVLRESSGRSTAGRRRARWSEGMVAGQVALSTILLVSTVLIFLTLYNLEHIHFGFDLDRVTTFIAMPGNAPGWLGSREEQAVKKTEPPESIVTRVYQPVADRIRKLPGVVEVTFSAWAPFDRNTMWFSFALPGRSTDEEHGTKAQICFVNSGYARAMGTPLVEGRMIEDSDTAGSTLVAVVNETFAKRLFQRRNPLGEHIVDQSKTAYTIVGVLGDARQHDLTGTPDPEVLYAYKQVPTTGFVYSLLVASGTNYIVRTRGDIDLSGFIRQVFRQSAPDFALDHFRTMRGALEEVTFNQRLAFYLTCSFAGVAILMVLSGLYSVLSQLVRQRTKEIGVRMALGATRGSILTMILFRGFFLALIGLSVGVPASVATARLLRAFLYGVKPTDVSTFIFASSILIGLSVGAAFLPARQATKVDPMVALRYE